MKWWFPHSLKTTVGGGCFWQPKCLLLCGSKLHSSWWKPSLHVYHVWRDHLGITLQCLYCPHPWWWSETSWNWHMNGIHPGASMFVDLAGVVKVKNSNPLQGAGNQTAAEQWYVILHMQWSFIPLPYKSMKSKEFSLFDYAGPYHSIAWSGVIWIMSWQHQGTPMWATKFSDIYWVRTLLPPYSKLFRALARVTVFSIWLHRFIHRYLLYHFASSMFIFCLNLLNHPFYPSISHLSNHWYPQHLNRYMYSSIFSCNQHLCLFINLSLLIKMHILTHFISFIIFWLE